MRPIKLLNPMEWILSAAVLLATLSCVGAETNAPPRSLSVTNRPANWAVKLNHPPLSNFHQITTNLYRGAQPSAKGMAELKKLGIRTIVNLRTFHSDDDEAAHLGMKLQRFRMQPWDRNEEGDAVNFLKIIADTNNYPVFVHCQRGADRTGLVCAMYRIVFEGWTKEAAIEEMTEGGYRFDRTWKNLIRYIERADIDRIKRLAGIK